MYLIWKSWWHKCIYCDTWHMTFLSSWSSWWLLYICVSSWDFCVSVLICTTRALRYELSGSSWYVPSIHPVLIEDTRMYKNRWLMDGYSPSHMVIICDIIGNLTHLHIPSENLLHSYWKKCHRNSGFTYTTWWFSIAMLVCQRVHKWIQFIHTHSWGRVCCKHCISLYSSSATCRQNLSCDGFGARRHTWSTDSFGGKPLAYPAKLHFNWKTDDQPLDFWVSHFQTNP